MNTRTRLLQKVERFLKRHRMAPTTFGEMAVSDGHFVKDLRNGRDVRFSTADKVEAFIEAYEGNDPPRRRMRMTERVAA